jgi:hypothetical protein
MPIPYEDRTLIKVIQCIAGFRKEHGSWPTVLRVHPAYHHDIEAVFSESSLKPVPGRLEIVADEKCGFVAENELGERHELDDELKGSEFRDVFNWLFNRSPMASHE